MPAANGCPDHLDHGQHAFGHVEDEGL